MKANEIRNHILQRLKSIPRSFGGYFKNSGSAIETAKGERNYFLAVFYPIVFFLSFSALIGVFLSDIENVLTERHSFVWLTKYADITNLRNAFIIGLMTTVVFWVTYVLVRFCCVKLFTKKVKAGGIFADTVIEFAMNCIPLSVLCFVGLHLCLLAWWVFIPGFVFVCLLYFILLIKGICDSVPKEKQNLLFHLTVTLFSFIGFILVAAATILVFVYVVVRILQGVNLRLREIADAISSILTGTSDFFKNTFGFFFR